MTHLGVCGIFHHLSLNFLRGWIFWQDILLHRIIPQHVLSENNVESRSHYKKAMILFDQERYNESLNYLDKAIELAPANVRLNDFRDTVFEMMEIKKILNECKKRESEMLKERENLIKKGVWKKLSVADMNSKLSY